MTHYRYFSAHSHKTSICGSSHAFLRHCHPAMAQRETAQNNHIGAPRHTVMSYGECRNLQSDGRTEDGRGSRIGSQSHLNPNRHYCADTYSQMTSGLNVEHPVRDKRQETSETTKKYITNTRWKNVEQKLGVAPETGLG